MIKIKKSDPRNLEMIVKEVGKINGIKVFDKEDQPTTGKLMCVGRISLTFY